MVQHIKHIGKKVIVDSFSFFYFPHFDIRFPPPFLPAVGCLLLVRTFNKGCGSENNISKINVAELREIFTRSYHIRTKMQLKLFLFYHWKDLPSEYHKIYI